jgi:hypothetical protein
LIESVCKKARHDELKILGVLQGLKGYNLLSARRAANSRNGSTSIKSAGNLCTSSMTTHCSAGTARTQQEKALPGRGQDPFKHFR